MTQHICILSILVLAIGCYPNKTERLIKQTPEFTSEYLLDTTLRYYHVQNVAYGFTCAIPETFTEQIDTIGQVDSSVHYSQQGEAKLIYFTEGSISRQDTLKNHLFWYFQKLETGRQSRVKNCKTLQSQLFYTGMSHPYDGYFISLGQVGNKQFIWKTELSEVPVSGDLAYVTMLFIYPKEREEYYQPIGVALAAEFQDE